VSPIYFHYPPKSGGWGVERPISGRIFHAHLHRHHEEREWGFHKRQRLFFSRRERFFIRQRRIQNDILEGMSELSNQPDYSVLDRPEIIQFIFYSRREWTSLPQGASDFFVPVEDEISISCRFYPLSHDAPCILYFHGNGEIACDYDQVAPLYHAQGISLFVADYRGYGLSDGEPSFSNMMKDAEAIFQFFMTFIIMPYQAIPLFVMGRSLGAHSAVALASLHSEKFKGLILESGSANLTRLLSWFEFGSTKKAKKLEEAALARIRSITLPVLIIHGECDELIPLTEATTFHDIVGSKEKKLILIPDGTHNNIMQVGKEQYFKAIKEFVFR